jgi:hypothetical protein
MGTMALIAAGGAIGTPGRLILAIAPIRWLGRISYSLYLWHWPVLVLGMLALAPVDPDAASPVQGLLLRLGLVTIAVVMAAISWRLVEEPFRAGRASFAGRRRVAAMVGAALLSVTVASTGLSYVAERDMAAGLADAAVDDPARDDDLDWIGSPVDDPTPRPAGPSPTSSPASQDPGRVPTPTATPVPRAKPRIDGRIPRDLTPSLGKARADEDPLLADGCASGWPAPSHRTARTAMRTAPSPSPWWATPTR